MAVQKLLIDSPLWENKLKYEWDYEKNGDPSLIKTFSHLKKWWICLDCRESFIQEVAKRSSYRNCTSDYCRKKRNIQRRIQKEGTFLDAFPILSTEWDREKNSIFPEDLPKDYGAKIWWKCKKGHSWKAITHSRRKGAGCPECALKSIGIKNREASLRKTGKLFYTNPELEKEWDFEKNSISPEEVSKGSHVKVWWRCVNNHSWEAEVRGRAVMGNGCLQCSTKNKSKLELSILHFVENIYEGKIISGDRQVISPKEIDIYLPELKIGFEVNGTYWHSDEYFYKKSGMSSSEYHSQKYEMGLEKGVQIFFIDEDDWVLKNADVKNTIEEIIKDRFL